MSPQEHTLLHPVTLKSGEKLSKISMRIYTLGEFISCQSDDRRDALDKLGVLVSGMDASDFENLSTPDHNTLIDYVLRQQTETSEDFLGKKLDPEKPELLMPITSDEAVRLTGLELRVPTVKAVRMRDKQNFDNDLDKAIWLTAHCTGLGSNDMRKLAMPDWMFLQGRLGSFLLKPAAYFRSGTSSN